MFQLQSWVAGGLPAWCPLQGRPELVCALRQSASAVLPLGAVLPAAVGAEQAAAAVAAGMDEARFPRPGGWGVRCGALGGWWHGFTQSPAGGSMVSCGGRAVLEGWEGLEGREGVCGGGTGEIRVLPGQRPGSKGPLERPATVPPSVPFPASPPSASRPRIQLVLRTVLASCNNSAHGPIFLSCPSCPRRTLAGAVVPRRPPAAAHRQQRAAAAGAAAGARLARRQRRAGPGRAVLRGGGGGQPAGAPGPRGAAVGAEEGVQVGRGGAGVRGRGARGDLWGEGRGATGRWRGSGAWVRGCKWWTADDGRGKARERLVRRVRTSRWPRASTCARGWAGAHR